LREKNEMVYTYSHLNCWPSSKYINVSIHGDVDVENWGKWYYYYLMLECFCSYLMQCWCSDSIFQTKCIFKSPLHSLQIKSHKFNVALKDNALCDVCVWSNNIYNYSFVLVMNIEVMWMFWNEITLFNGWKSMY